ncbi:hypothetical protein [Sandaracinus amylolyticus]|uniref:hypothetical protein n=1 Tax=Sandaracinus amylolyticus TaxID=927083 RepID=UPI001F3E0130|nr:hypothetical protein [Sandaracinus amylolyticus]UJR85093.1 Hypothetical protein I5071_71720 [Sandaracinus amylolyticus]
MFCPKCGDAMTATRDGTTLECVRGNMELSVAMRAGLVEIFVERRRSAKRVGHRFGGEWFCPGCGGPMIVDDGVQCPRCSEHLDELVYQLVELHPHRVRRRLLVVEERFEIAGRGLVLMPGVPAGEATRSELSVELLRPDGTTAVVRAHVEITFAVPLPKERWATVRLEGVTKADLPIGTELWLDEG